MNQHLIEICYELYIQWWRSVTRADHMMAFESGFEAAINWAREHKDEL